MTDLEMLELAAKAFGFGDPNTGSTCWTESEYPRKSGKNGALWNYVGNMDSAELWNPLTDDGDAFRLAAHLRIAIKPGKYAGGGATAEPVHGGTAGATVFNDAGMAAQMRKAIVMVAAEIGKSMKESESK